LHEALAAGDRQLQAAAEGESHRAQAGVLAGDEGEVWHWRRPTAGNGARRHAGVSPPETCQRRGVLDQSFDCGGALRYAVRCILSDPNFAEVAQTHPQRDGSEAPVRDHPLHGYSAARAEMTSDVEVHMPPQKSIFRSRGRIAATMSSTFSPGGTQVRGKYLRSLGRDTLWDMTISMTAAMNP
jgi:hypothetical protein